MTTVLVIGGAPCVADDLAAVARFGWPVIAVNDQIARYPGEIIAGATMHPEKALGWREQRHQTTPWFLWSGQEALRFAGIDRAIRRKPSWHGTSALFAAQVALRELHFDRVVLAGCPIDERQNVFHCGTLGEELEWYRQGWAKALPHIRGCVFSMSGWTRDLLGAPEL